RTRLTIFTCWLGQSTVLDAREAFSRAGVPTYFTPDKAIKAFMHQVNHQRSQRLLKETPKSHVDYPVERENARSVIANALKHKRNYLSNAEARKLLQDYRIPTVETWYCDDEDEVVETFLKVGRPVSITI